MDVAIAALTVYLEVFGKAGAYGVGVERAITRRLALGVAASYTEIRDEQIATVAPYVHGVIAQRGRHVLFTEIGATLVHLRVPSPVAGWDGARDTGGGGFASLGWERRGRRIVTRVALSAVAGEGGVAPWGGVAIGFAP